MGQVTVSRIVEMRKVFSWGSRTVPLADQVSGSKACEWIEERE
jgi:hypothetical protein